ncbi:TRAP transporter substrate-binding protein [Ramlibacter sp. AN1015]|uniref:TRAP transporter substrate-binding protein n=1 Tax=Ramlibacter sp. AN1015 TaxID=3133428 RepID=UPI0030BA6409
MKLASTSSRALRPVAALAAAGLLAFGAQAQDKPVELKLAHWVPPNHALFKTGFEPWSKSVEAASKGTIKVSIFPAQQLGKAADHYDMARDGIADMTFVNPGYQAGRFPVIAAGELPFLVSKPGPASAALDAWYRKYAPTEMKDVKVCLAHLHIGTIHAKKPITEPAQIKGMKIRSSNATNAAFVSLLGGTNVQVSAPEARDALEKGVADALSFPWESVVSFGIDKAVKYHTDMRLYASNFVWAMNKNWYDKLSASQKKVIDDHCNNEWAAKVGAGWGDLEDAGQGKLEKAPGHTIVKLTPAQMDQWRKAAEPLYVQWTQNVDKAGVSGKQALDELRKEIDARKAN